MAFFNTDGLGNSLLGAGIDFLSATYNNKMAAEREAAARQENYKYGEMAANAADDRTRALYSDLYSPEAQMQQIKSAGLSPSIYASGGISGKSGVSGAMGTGAGNVSPQTYGINPLEAAQLGLIHAQTKKTEAEADNLNADTGVKEVQLLNIVADTNNKRVEHRLLNAEADLKDLEFMDNVETRQARISQAYHNANIAAAEARSAAVKADLDEATFHVAYQMAFANLDNVLSDTALNKSEINVNKQQIKEIAERIRNSQWETWAMEKDQNRKDAIFQLDRAKLEAECKKWAAEINVELNGQKLKMVSDLVGYVCNAATCGMSNTTEIKKSQMYNETKKQLANKKTVETETTVHPNKSITTKSKTKSSSI